MVFLRNRLSFSPLLLGGVVVSLVLALLHYGALAGSAAALVVTVLTQFYLPGYLLARALGKHREDNLIVRFAWILAAAFGLSITLGGLARLVHIPVPVYVVLLHGVMLGLALLKAPHPLPANREAGIQPTALSRSPLYALVALCCVIVLGVALERSQYRFNGYEDQTVFIELADWLAHDNDDPGLRSRRVGVIGGDARWDTDGWTYTHAAWVWTSGRSAAQLIWFDLTPLFVWAAPLAVFALAYEVTRRESAAAWTVAALTLFGLMTVDSLVYYPTTITFGQFSLFQVNTLRTISTALVTPLALLPVMAYLRQPNRRDLVLLALIGFAVAALHPRQIVILLYSTGATAGLWLLAKPSRARLMQAGALGVVLLALMVLPLAQRLARPSIDWETAQVTEAATESPRGGQPKVIPEVSPGRAADVKNNTAAQDEPIDEDELTGTNPRTSLVTIGSTYIIDPAFVFYHPLVLVGVVLSLAAGWWWRRSLAAQYLFGTTVITMLLLFMPGIAALFGRLVTPSLAPGVIFAVPVPLALGIVKDNLLSWLGKHLPRESILRGAAAALVAVVLLALVFEPFPIPASARDQIRASNLMQATRDIHPSDVALVDALRGWLPDDRRSVIISPNRVASAITESVPYTLVTGGRASSNFAFPGNRRFFNEGGNIYPFLDRIDIQYMRRWNVTHIVVEADNTRLASLLLQPERFELLGAVEGFYVFRVGTLEETPADARFFQMNRQYIEQAIRRWTPDGFDLTLPPGTRWRRFVAGWQNEEGDLARMGEAFAYLMAGDDAAALPLFEALHAAHPSIPLFAEATAHLQAALGSPEAGEQTLLAALDADTAATRVLAARALLTDDFFYLLDETEREHVLTVTRQDSVTWDQLANLYRESAIRERAVLLMSAGELDAADTMLSRIYSPEALPSDFVTRAAIALARGNVAGALAILEPTTDADWIAANVLVHPDQWQNNLAAQTYRLLTDESQVTALRDELPAGEPVSMRAIADSGRLYVMSPAVEMDDENGTLTVTATYGNPHIAPYPVREWRVQLTSPDASEFYASVDVPAVFAPGMLTRIPVTLELPDDVPPLTAALVYIEPRYDNRVTFGNLTVPVVLNRPDAADAPDDAETIGLRFGEQITLEYAQTEVTDEAVTVTLYWSANAAPDENYQVFVHVVGANGEPVAQQDSAPVDNRYPTSLWRADTLIADAHHLPLDAPLPDGAYRVVVGMYRLPEATRLPVTPADARVENDAVTVAEFIIGE